MCRNITLRATNGTFFFLSYWFHLNVQFPLNCSCGSCPSVKEFLFPRTFTRFIFKSVRSWMESNWKEISPGIFLFWWLSNQVSNSTSAGRVVGVGGASNGSGMSSSALSRHWGPERSVNITRDPTQSLGISIVGGKVLQHILYRLTLISCI